MFHSLVPKIYPSNPNLANWVDMQRTQYRLLKVGMPSYLNDERIASLEEIGFVWNVHDFKWQQRYEELQSFGVSGIHVCEDWRSRQRDPQLAD